MKKFIRTIQSLGDRATEFQDAIKQLPPKVAGIREAVTLTTGQLQQLQADVQMNMTDLKADGHDRQIQALHEINGSIEVFQEAGYELGQVEMELSPVSRLIVHLNRINDVHDSMLRSLASANSDQKITHALLNSVMQAEAMADEVDISGQIYYKLIVHIGPVPAVRLCWMPEGDSSALASTTRSQAIAQLPDSESDSLPTYGKSSYFEHRSPTQPEPQPTESPASEAASEPVEAAPVETPTALEPAAPTASAAKPEVKSRRSGGKDWGASSLERFKKMPSVSKYRR